MEKDVEVRIFAAPLLNFNTTIDPIVVCEGYEIVRFTDSDKIDLHSALSVLKDSNTSYEKIIDFRLIRDTSFWIKSIQNLSIGEELNTAEGANQVRRIVSAARLLKPGDIGAPWIFDVPQDLKSLGRHWVSELGDSSVRRRGDTSIFSLLQSDLEELRALHKALVDSEKSLHTALRRYNFAYQREDVSDRIIDLAIALESSLLNDVEEELQYRLALRGATLLADSRNPSETAELLKGMYKVRSKIVHGGWSLEDACKSAKVLGNKRPAEFVDECMDVARMVLRKYTHRLASDKAVSKICQDLDRRIVGGLSGERSH